MTPVSAIYVWHLTMLVWSFEGYNCFVHLLLILLRYHNYAIWCNICKTLLVSLTSYLTIKLVNVEIKERQWKLFQLPFHSVKVQYITSPLAVISEIHHGPSLIGYIYVNNNLLRSTSSASYLWIMQNAMLNSDVAVSYFQ